MQRVGNGHSPDVPNSCKTTTTVSLSPPFGLGSPRRGLDLELQPCYREKEHFKNCRSTECCRGFSAARVSIAVEPVRP